MQIQLVDQPRVLQYGYEFGGREEAPLGIDPAGQGLLVADPAVGRPDDGLVVDLYPSLGDGLVQVGGDVLLPLGPLVHGAVVMLHRGGVGAVYGIAGDLGPVVDGADVHALRRLDADAHQYGGAVAPPGLEQALQTVRQRVRLGENGKVILAEAAAAVFPEDGDEEFCKIPQQRVAGGKAVALVVEFEPAEVQVEEGGAAALVDEGLPLLLHAFKEVDHARKAGQQVVVIALLDVLLKLALQLVPVFLVLVFQHEAVQYAGAQQAADGVHGQQRKAGLQRDKQRHRQAGQTDGTVAQPHGPRPGRSQGIDGGRQEHHDLCDQ